MAEEAKHLDQIKWPKKCASCDVIVDKTGWLYEHQLYCEAHKPKESSTPQISQTPISQKVMCQNCGDSVDHVTHIINIGARDIDLSICDRCEWLRRAAWQLKLNGMWKPTPKNEPLREAKP